MRKIIPFLLAIFLSCTLLFSFLKIPTPDNNNGVIGDVKYSILNPISFRKANGEGWILLDGGANVEAAELYETSKLKSEFQFSHLPDARGIFIRGMNEGRDIATGDADGNRTVGTFQGDQFLSHSHNISLENGVPGQPGFPPGQQGYSQVSDKGTKGIFNEPFISRNGGNETRPRNVALYIYIKIN